MTLRQVRSLLVGVLPRFNVTAAVVGFLAAVILFSTPNLSWSAPPRVAVAPATGPQGSKLRSLTYGVVEGLRKAGLKTVAGKRYRRVAAEQGLDPTDPRAAVAANAELLVILQTREAPNKKGYRVVIRLLDQDGRMIERLRTKYAQRARRKGRAIGRKLASLIIDDEGANDAGAAAALPLPPPPPPRAAQEELPPPAPLPPPPARSPTRRGTFAMQDDDTPPARIEARSLEPDDDGAERSMFRFRVSGGTQVASSYGVSVGGVDTGLQYDLGVVPLVQADFQFALVDIGFGARAEFNFSPVSFVVDVTPVVEPREPSGFFISAGGHLFYDIDLMKWGEGGRFAIAPLVGGGVNLLDVESQGVNSVVVGYNAVDVSGGARFIVQLSQDFVIEAEGRGGYVLSFTEDPTTTGADATGFTIQAGAAVRYWLLSSLGVSLDATYRQMEVDFTGLGTRAGFVGDPILDDASLSVRDVKVALGVVVGF